MRAQRRRGLLLLSLALASGGLAASQVRERERSVEAKVGPVVPVAVAAREVPADHALRPSDLTIRQVPARYVPPDALAGPSRLVGARTAAPVAAGGYLTASALQGAGGGRPGVLRPGERAIEVAVGGGSALAGAAEGSRVDVVVSTQSREGAGRAFLALEDVELLGLRDYADDGSTGPPQGGDSPAATALATLRVDVRQAVYLAAAQNFGREVRLLVRPPGDRARGGRWSVGEGEL